MTDLQNGLKNNQFLKTGLAAVPWLKAASGLLDFFIGGGKASPQQVQIMPMAVNLSMRLSGTMTTSNQYHNIIFSNPGSLNAPNDPDIYPFYNEILGVFNLLKGPVFLSRVIVEREGSPREGFTFVTHIYRKLKEPMKWVINPASKLELQDAQVAFVAVTNDSTSTTPPASMGNGFDFVEGKNAETKTWQYRTEYVNINCLGPENVFHFGGGRYIIPRSLFIKFILNFKRLDNPSAQNVLTVLTYPIGGEATTADITSGPGFSASRCSGGAIMQATAAEITSFCSSTQYTTNRTGRRANMTERKEAIPGNEIEVLPNPATDRLILKGTSAKTVRTILLYNAQGSVAMKRILNISGNFTREFNVSTLNKGVYFLSIVFADGKTQVKKIMITK